MKIRATVVGAAFFFSCLFGATLAAEEVAVMVSEGMMVKIDYTLTVDGEIVDESPEGQPLQYIHGSGQIIPGLEKELEGLKVGDSKSVTVTPEEGYGPVNPEAFIEVLKQELADDLDVEVGTTLSGVDPEGRLFRARVEAIDGENITLDMNHPLAGKTLNFEVAVVEITPSP